MAVSVVCQHCGKAFTVRPYKLAEGKGKYCSRRCYMKSRPVNAMPYRQIVGARYEHRAVAERALGRLLPKSAHVHHVNEDTMDNRPQNLVICQDAAYHRLLHARTRVVRAGGDPNTQRFCGRCQTLYAWPGRCRPCDNKTSMARYYRNRQPGTRAYRRKEAA